MYHYTEADLNPSIGTPKHKHIVTTSDEQTQAQAELNAYLEQQAQAIKRETTNTVAKRERSTSPIQEGDKVFYLVCLNDFTRRIACNDEELDWTWCSAIVKKVYKKTVDLEYRIEHTHTLFHAKKVKISRLRREVKDSYSVAVYDGFETQRA